VKLRVSLENTNPGTNGFHTLLDANDDNLLPVAGLTTTSLLGGYGPGHEAIDQLYARQIASAIVMKAPGEKRVLLVGLGLNASTNRSVFAAITDLVLRCI
jgi:proteasome assembly chaperone 3